VRLMTWPELRIQLAINTRGKCLDLDGMSRVPGGRRNPYGTRSAEFWHKTTSPDERLNPQSLRVPSEYSSSQ
jgi:hypothetical protein